MPIIQLFNERVRFARWLSGSGLASKTVPIEDPGNKEYSVHSPTVQDSASLFSVLEVQIV